MKPCPHCNAENAYDARFCVACGRYFGGVEKDANAEETPFGAADARLSAPQVQNPQSPPSSRQAQSPYPSPASPRGNFPPPSPALPMPAPTDEEICVENHTAYTQQTLKDFYKPLKLLSVLLIVLGGLIFLLALYGISGPDENVEPLGIYISAALVFLGVFYLLYLRSQIRQSRLFNDTTVIVYRFVDKGIFIQTFDGDQKCGEEYFFYHKISKVYKTKTLILIRSGIHVFFVRRDGFVKGDETRLQQFLSARCPKVKVKI